MTSKGEKAKDAITQAARDLFYRKGYAATSIADIADKSGHAKGNIQYHFSTKDDILRSVTKARLTDFQDFLDRCQTAAPSACVSLNRFIDMLEDNAEDLVRFGCPIGTLNGELGKDNPELQEDARQMFDVLRNWLEAQFAQVVPPDRVRADAEHLLVLAQGQTMMAHAYRDAEIIRRQSRALRDWLARECDRHRATGNGRA
ncbi:MAG: TetR/AcrR family transcriptional regulator [Marinibacterium sp.]